MRRRPALFIMALALAALRAFAHEDLEHFVHHAATIAVGARNLDITVHLTFYGGLARAEREAIDTTRDGRIDNSERAVYAAWIAKETAGAATLALIPSTESTMSIPAVPLYDPQINLHDSWTTAGHPLTLTLTYFVRAPDKLSPDAELRVNDTLWLHAPVISTTIVDAAHPILARPLHDAPQRFDENVPRIYGVRITR